MNDFIKTVSAVQSYSFFPQSELKIVIKRE